MLTKAAMMAEAVNVPIMAWKATRTRFVTFCGNNSELLDSLRRTNHPAIVLTFLCGQLYGSASVMSGTGLRSKVPCVFRRYWRCSSEIALISSCTYIQPIIHECRLPESTLTEYSFSEKCGFWAFSNLAGEGDLSSPTCTVFSST